MAESNAATWITRSATNASSQTSQMLSSRYWAGFHNNQAHTTPLTSINKVGSSDGAVPCMTLPKVFPVGVDHDHYINDANNILRSIAA